VLSLFALFRLLDSSGWWLEIPAGCIRDFGKRGVKRHGFVIMPEGIRNAESIDKAEFEMMLPDERASEIIGRLSSRRVGS
jgi:hypothetical protein